MTDGTNEVTLSSSSAPNQIGVPPSSARWLREPRKSDAAAIHRLISDCPPLDLNSVYTYLLLSEHFSPTCVVAGTDESMEGFISGYIRPDQPNVLFVWQVAVHADARGTGLAGRMLAELLQRDHLSAVEYIETTVGPENRASRAMFASLARNLLAPLKEKPLFERGHFGAQGHEDEPLLRIGPFQTARLTSSSLEAQKISPEAPTEHFDSEKIVMHSASQPGEEI